MITPETSPQTSLSHIDHVGVAVHDVEAASSFFIQHFGMHLIHDETLEEVGVRLVYLGPGPTMLQLVEPISEGSISKFLVEHGEGIHHLCFGVVDIPSFLKGVPGSAGVELFMGGRGRRACFLDGSPSGVLVELTELARWSSGPIGR